MSTVWCASASMPSSWSSPSLRYPACTSASAAASRAATICSALPSTAAKYRVVFPNGPLRLGHVRAGRDRDVCRRSGASAVVGAPGSTATSGEPRHPEWIVGSAAARELGAAEYGTPIDDPDELVVGIGDDAIECRGPAL